MMDGFFRNLMISTAICSGLSAIFLAVLLVVQLATLGHIALAIATSFVFVTVFMAIFITIMENL